MSKILSFTQAFFGQKNTTYEQILLEIKRTSLFALRENPKYRPKADPRLIGAYDRNIDLYVSDVNQSYAQLPQKIYFHESGWKVAIECSNPVMMVFFLRLKFGKMYEQNEFHAFLNKFVEKEESMNSSLRVVINSILPFFDKATGVEAKNVEEDLKKIAQLIESCEQTNC